VRRALDIAVMSRGPHPRPALGPDRIEEKDGATTTPFSSTS
jgi:hypothetical protein